MTPFEHTIRTLAHHCGDTPLNQAIRLADALTTTPLEITTDPPPDDLNDHKALGEWARHHPLITYDLNNQRPITAHQTLRNLTGATHNQARLALATISTFWSRTSNQHDDHEDVNP